MSRRPLRIKVLTFSLLGVLAAIWLMLPFEADGVGEILAYGIPYTVVLGVLAWAMWRQMNWARIAVLILLSIGIVSFVVIGFPLGAAYDVNAALTEVALAVVPMSTIVWFLLLPSTRRYFSRPPQ